MTRRRPWETPFAVLLAVGLCIAMAGCDDAEKERSTCPEGLGNLMLSGPLPPLWRTIGFANKVGKKTYPAVSAPAAPPTLRWDFSGKQVYAYDFSQTNKTAFSMGIGGDVTRKDRVSGTLLLRSKGNGTAAIVLRTGRIAVDGPGGKQKMSRMPLVVVQGVKEDGSMRVRDSSIELVLAALFPLAGKPVKVGQTVSVPMAMPFNALGSALYVEGAAKITLTGYVEINGRTCARLVTDIDISRLDVPKELKGTYEWFTVGTSVAYFDVRDRRFVSVDLALTMGMHVEAALYKMEIEGEKMPPMPDKRPIWMKTDSLIRLTYNAKKSKQ